MKIDIELNIVNDKKYLNFWNYLNGDDYICEIKDGKIINDDGEEVSFEEFINEIENKFGSALESYKKNLK